jgi:hypothetical protein
VSLLKIFHRWTIPLLAAVILAVVSLPTANAGEPAAAPLQIVDVLGATVRIAVPAAAPTVLIFMSRRSQDASAALARAVDERLIDRPIESIGIVDVRRYAGMLRGLASSRLRRAAEQAKERRRERRQARGVDASAAAVDRWHLVGDFDGSLFARYAVAADLQQPLAFVVDCAGRLHGPFRDGDAVALAVEHGSTRPAR